MPPETLSRPLLRTLKMSPVPSPIRLATEAGRAIFGVWLVIFSIVVAPRLYQWLGVHHADRPSYALGSGVLLATLACVGMGAAVMAGLRALTAAIATAGMSSSVRG